MSIGAALAGLGQGLPQGIKDSQGLVQSYHSGVEDAATAAAGQGLQLLQALSMQPPQPPPMQPPPPIPGTQGIPGVNGQQAQAPMGGASQQGQMPMGGGGPPMGQGSPPMGPPQGQGQIGGQPPQPMGGGPMGQGQQLAGSLNWQTLIQAVQRGNPGAPPQLIMEAVNKLIPFMSSQSMLEWRHMQAQLGQQRVDVTARGQDIRADTAERGQDVRAETAKGAQEVVKRGQDVRAETAKEGQKGTQERFNVREARITAHQMVTADQAWQRLDQQRKQAETRGDVTAKRAALDAQHKRTMEVIAAWSRNTDMPPETRKQLLKDADDAYTEAIRALGKGGKENFDSRFKGAGQSTP